MPLAAGFSVFWAKSPTCHVVLHWVRWVTWLALQRQCWAEASKSWSLSLPEPLLFWAVAMSPSPASLPWQVVLLCVSFPPRSLFLWFWRTFCFSPTSVTACTPPPGFPNTSGISWMQTNSSRTCHLWLPSDGPAVRTTTVEPQARAAAS